ncbi:MAG: DUF6483 family protein [Clostridium sp.]|nr:DUF6483 family protein [Clostridium sp.]
MKNDYLLDMVESFGKNLGKCILNKNEEPAPIEFGDWSDKDTLLAILKKLISERKYNDAEDVLFEFLEQDRSENIKSIGNWFYNSLSKLSDEELVSGNFSREEIAQGYYDFLKLTMEI